MAAAARMARQRAEKPRLAGTRQAVWLNLVIAELIPAPCIARGVDVPGSTPDCNKRLHPVDQPSGLACGTHNALAVQSLQETPDALARDHWGHLWHDRDAS